MMATMSRKRDDLACAEAILAVSSRLLTHWELHSDAIWALPLNAAGTGNVPNLKPISRHRTRSSCKDTRYGNNVRALSVVRPILDLIACFRIMINIDIDIFNCNAANETPLQMILYNCITLRLGGGRPTAANLREVHSADLYRRNRSGQVSRVYDIKRSCSPTMAHALLTLTSRAMAHLSHLHAFSAQIKRQKWLVCH
jgi:hypothetical protein